MNMLIARCRVMSTDVQFELIRWRYVGSAVNTTVLCNLAIICVCICCRRLVNYKLDKIMHYFIKEPLYVCLRRSIKEYLPTFCQL